MYHSTTGVDRFLESRLPSFGYAVDVGANNGTYQSNSLHFEENGWAVMCVEPNPLLSDELKSTRKLALSVACGSIASNMEFVAVGDRPYFSGSGFHVDRARSIKALPTVEQRFMVDVVTLDFILQWSGFPRLDFLTMDVEGHEFDVLKGCDFSKWKPKYVVAESWPPGPDFADYLTGNGYVFVERLGLDYVYERH